MVVALRQQKLAKVLGICYEHIENTLRLFCPFDGPRRVSDNPLDRIPSFDRVSIRAVVVRDDEDPSQALSDAGIFEPIALPVLLGEDQPDFSFGDGITPNLTAVLEPDQEADEFDSADQPAGIQLGPDQIRPSRQTRPATATLPAAYGARPLAPVRPRGS
jgi:hypothetical protein